MKFSLAALLLATLSVLPKEASAFVVPNHGGIASDSPRPTTRLFGADEFAFKTVPAAEKYSGGPISVDLNTYNLSLEQATDEWTASKVVGSAKQKDGVYLEPRSNRLVYVEKVQCRIQRKPGEGLGIELFELAGGRQDGVGITLVSGLVEGSVSEGSGLQPGDSIIDMTVVAGNMELEMGQAGMECCDWDTTVAKIGSLPAATDDPTEALLVTVKRLRRKPMVKVTVFSELGGEKPKKKTVEVFAGENLRRALITRGVKLDDPYAKAYVSGGSTEGIPDCTSEKCFGDCKIIATEGSELLNEKTPQDMEELGKDNDERMLCRCVAGYGMKEGSLTVQLVE